MSEALYFPNLDVMDICRKKKVCRKGIEISVSFLN